MPADSPFDSRLRARLADLRSQGLERAMRPPRGVDLSSNDYLALSTHPAVVEAFAAGATREGAGSTGSRLLRGDRDLFHTLEERFATFKRAPRALFFSSGYLANIAVMSTLPEAGDVIFSDALNHASLIDGIRLSRAAKVVFPHRDVDALRRLVRATPCGGVRFVVVESLFSMDGDTAPLVDLAAVCRESGATLIVDEAHAVGVCGATGSGGIEAAGLDGEALVSINTAGKALGVAGAFVCGPQAVVEYLVQRARSFVFSTAPPPAIASALLASLDVIRDEPERRRRVTALARQLRAALGDAGIEVDPSGSHIIPIHVGDNERAMAVAAALQVRGFDVRAIRPPTVPDGTARLRLSVNVTLHDEVIPRFVQLLSGCLKEAGVCAASS